MTIDQMAVRAAELIQDAGNRRWPSAQLFRFINDAQSDLQRGSKFLRKQSAALTVSSTLPANSFYTLPADFLELEPGEVWDQSSGISRQLVGRTVSQMGNQWDAIAGNYPAIYIEPLEFGHTEVRVWPIPDVASTTVTIYYAYLPADLTTGQTTPLPAQYHMALVRYAVGTAFGLPGQSYDPAQEQKFMGAYGRDLEDASNAVVRRLSAKGAVMPYRRF